ncbi:MAG TPA: GNAT family N-acetyltransferase [Spirochaetaceae bacterium]|nr:GNAT family N-acetyltransferase [Spirochaetaceae bacterium]
MGELVIRRAVPADFAAIVALNSGEVRHTSPMDGARLRRLDALAAWHQLAVLDGQPAAFILALRDHVAYRNDNYEWFAARQASFLYIDRIVIARPRRGGGRGRAFYADVQSFAEVRWPQLACEVFLQTGNDPALLFHGSFGFREVGQNVMPASGIRASMLLKEMCSYPFVAETYGGKLPDLPWLRTRPLPGRQAALATGT